MGTAYLFLIEYISKHVLDSFKQCNDEKSLFYLIFCIFSHNLFYTKSSCSILSSKYYTW